MDDYLARVKEIAADETMTEYEKYKAIEAA
jgi:hypothetical protein